DVNLRAGVAGAELVARLQSARLELDSTAVIRRGDLRVCAGFEAAHGQAVVGDDSAGRGLVGALVFGVEEGEIDGDAVVVVVDDADRLDAVNPVGHLLLEMALLVHRQLVARALGGDGGAGDVDATGVD